MAQPLEEATQMVIASIIESTVKPSTMEDILNLDTIKEAMATGEYDLELLEKLGELIDAKVDNMDLHTKHKSIEYKVMYVLYHAMVDIMAAMLGYVTSELDKGGD
jgi:hypothetical protein